MFSATYFTYDGVFSGEYGLMMADFDAEPVVETAAFSPVLNAMKPADNPRFLHGGIRYDAPPTHRFSIISEQEIPDVLRREILTWLVGRNEFKKLQVHQPDLEDYYYNCVFTDVDIVYINARCHGFRVTANFDSHYARSEAAVIVIPAGTTSYTVAVDADVIDGYIYPLVEFTGSHATIYNFSDGAREFTIGQNPGGAFFVDNESKIILKDGAVTRLDAVTFNKQWMRLKRGNNELAISCDGDLTITIPTYVMIGF